jgi:hypothetical protein
MTPAANAGGRGRAGGHNSFKQALALNLALEAHASGMEELRMHNVWFASSVWLALALAASIISIRAAISVALIEIVVGAIAGNTIGLEITLWVNFLAGFGAILLTFLAGTEIDAQVIRKNLGASVGIGAISFLAPYLGVLLYAQRWFMPALKPLDAPAETIEEVPHV